MMIDTVPASLSDDSRRAAVMARDRAADGTFVYGVRSTGIFCRPSCSSRRPTRSVLEFFVTPADARDAGYRACKRCQPEQVAVDPWVDRIRRACVYLSNVDGQPLLDVLARRLGGSPYHLQRNFKRIVGVTPRQFAEARRLEKVKRGLSQGRDVTSALFEAGYSSSSRFYEGTGVKFGLSPSSYRRGGGGATIGYAIGQSSMGLVLMAATVDGVCAVLLGDSAEALVADLRREFSAATLVEDGTRLARWLDQAIEHLHGALPRLDLPLDIRATAFQWQVWNALVAIPRGETRSYGQIAAAIGRRTASRAVARACATNPVAVAIPCHRVVPAAGGVGGYRWGAARKQQILAAERLSVRRARRKL